MIFLSHVINQYTPTYGNRNRVLLEKKSDISKGDVANDTYFASTVHIGTHIDMPYHFYENGQTIKDFEASFWNFKKPLVVEISPQSLVIKSELIDALKDLKQTDYDLLIVKTGIYNKRQEDIFWSHNYGFHPDLYDFLLHKLPNLRVFGFDSISISSFSERMLGREAHRRFLNPQKPILLLEDMKLDELSKMTKLQEVIIAPLRLEKCDGLPCTVIGKLSD